MSSRRTLDETREMLLAAGLDLLSETGVTASMEHIGLLDVCKRAGLTTAGSAYKIWPNQAAFRDDLVKAMFASSTSSEVTVPAVLRLKDEVDHDLAGFRELLRSSSNIEAETMLGSAGYHNYVAMWCVAGTDPELAASLRDADIDLLDGLALLYELLADEFDLEFVPPFTSRDVATTLSALIEGFAIRARYEPERVAGLLVRPTGPDGADQSWHLFACATEAIVSTYVRPRRAPDAEA